MAIRYFTHLCAFLRRSINHVFLHLAYRYDPDTFNKNLLLSICGRSVYVSKFPPFVLGISDPPGWYFVESVIYFHSGQVGLGLEITPGDIEFYSFSDIEIDFSQKPVAKSTDAGASGSARAHE